MIEGTGRIGTRAAALIAWLLWILVALFFVVNFADSFALNELRQHWYMLSHPRLWSAEDIGGILMWGILPIGAILAYTTVGAVGSTGFAVLADSFSGTWVNPSAAEWVGFLAALIAFLISVAAVILRWRRSMGQERQQLKWLAYTVAVTFVAVLGGTASLYVWKDSTGDAPFLLIFTWVVAMAGVTVGIPVAIGLAILKHRLYDIDRIINRTLVYATLTAFLVLFYLGGVATTQTILRNLTDQDQQPQLVIVVSTLVIAALFNPLRRGIQSFIDRGFYRSKYDAAKTLEAFSATLRDETDLDALNDDLVGVVRETMQPAHVSLWLRRDTAPQRRQSG